jgi:uncharacterized membrane protein YhaH (DUF805 family)
MAFCMTRMKLVRLMLSPIGRVCPLDFWIGISVLLVLFQAPKLLFSEFLYFFDLFDFIQIIEIAAIYLIVCVHGKRLHDAGYSAWWIMVPIGFSITIGVAARIAFPQNSETNLVLVNPEVEKFDLAVKYIVWPIWTLWLGTRKSQLQDNKYGLGPKGASTAEVFE